MMHHLIRAEKNPIHLRAVIIEAAQKARSRLDSVHHEMNGKIENSEVPERRVHIKHNRKAEQTVNSRVNGKRERETPPFIALLEHINILEDKIRQKVFNLKNDQEGKDPRESIICHSLPL